MKKAYFRLARVSRVRVLPKQSYYTINCHLPFIHLLQIKLNAMDDSQADIWTRSFAQSRPYWQLYEQLMPTHVSGNNNNQKQLLGSNVDTDNCTHSDHDEEYAKFIEVTRRHQAQRNKRRKLEEQSEQQYYYMDISQVNTLVEQNLAEVPLKTEPNDITLAHKREQDLIKLYGNRKTYEHIKSMEMSIDNNFNKRCQELKPHFWPAIPFNTKVYLDKPNHQQ